MELSFDIIEIIRRIHEEPGILVAFAAFHPFAFLLLCIPFGVLKKTWNYTPNENIGLLSFSIIMIFAVGWILGFASQIMFLFMGIPGIKMFFIYLSMYLCITAFIIVNGRDLLNKYFKKNQLLKAIRYKKK